MACAHPAHGVYSPPTSPAIGSTTGPLPPRIGGRLHTAPMSRPRWEIPDLRPKPVYAAPERPAIVGVRKADVPRLQNLHARQNGLERLEVDGFQDVLTEPDLLGAPLMVLAAVSRHRHQYCLL